MVDVSRGKRAASLYTCLLVARFLVGYLHLNILALKEVIVVVTILNEVGLIIIKVLLERFVLNFAVDIYVALALAEGALEKCSLCRIRTVAVVDSGSEANHAVVEAEYRLACNKVRREVLELALHKLHGKHAVLSLQRT